MTYHVRITPTALKDAENFYQWIADHSPANAAKWFNGLFEAINTLSSFPRRCPAAPEAGLAGQEVRCLLYKKRYRILYGIQDEVVTIYHIRHTAQRWMKQEEFLRKTFQDKK